MAGVVCLRQSSTEACPTGPPNLVYLGMKKLRVLLLVSLGGLGIVSAAETLAQSVDLISRNDSAEWADDDSYTPRLSADGNVAAFVSAAENLAPEASESPTDIYVRNLLLGTTQRVNLSSGGQPEDQQFFVPARELAISADGRYVAFESLDGALATPAIQVVIPQIFVRDTVAGTTEVVSLDNDAEPLNSLEVSFNCCATLSGDGRFVAFITDYSFATGERSGFRQVARYDRLNENLEPVSVTPAGDLSNLDADFDTDITPDGRFIVFASGADDIVDAPHPGRINVYIRDFQLGRTELISPAINGEHDFDSWDATVSDDGRFVAFTSESSQLVDGDTNGIADVFVRDRLTEATRRISVNSQGSQLQNCGFATPPLPPIGGRSPAISGNGKWVAFESTCSDIVNEVVSDNVNLYAYDLATAALRLAHRATNGDPGNLGAATFQGPSISRTGQYIAFASNSSNLVQPDENPGSDAWRYNQGLDAVDLVYQSDFEPGDGAK